MVARESHGVAGLNGKTGELLRWIFMLVLGGVIAYYTAQIASERRFATIEARVESSRAVEQQHFEEIQRALARIEAELIRNRERDNEHRQ